MTTEAPLPFARLESLRDRQLQAWQRGERLLVEGLIGDVFSSLSESELLELIFAEVMLRGERGEVCDSEEYLQRFPQFAESLKRLFAIHEAMEAPADELDETVLGPKVDRPAGSTVPRGADRNLLFGIMALQMDFIGRDALVDALRDWTTQKDKPLGQILVERGDLASTRRDLLEPLVDEHVRQHEGDPAASLAAVSSIVDASVNWHRVHDVDIAESLASRRLVRNAHPSGSSNTTARTTGNTGASRFRVLRPHAEGGLGCVLVAQDEELHREVALKEIKRQFAGDMASRNRFTLEAEVTGGLEHPGIVPVYGLGQYSDGRPYYAMRFIRGDSLKEAIEQFHGAAGSKSALASPTPARGDEPTFVSGTARVTAAKTTEHPAQTNVSPEAFASLEFRKLLGRFIDVCQAIEYAHSRGVLHRDLKPGNIMLGKYGETLVVDWGLAKVAGKDDRFTNVDEATLVPSSGSSIENTAAGSVIGTPAYMSPEQASGKLEHLGPTTDVYSLGATLYHILTGHAPYSKLALPELLARVQRGEFPHPRELNSSIPKSLEAICLKAMSLRQEDRYMSAAAVAEDLEHWLADEPVDALAETSFQRASRWARRHRSWATAGLFAVAAIAVVASIAFFIVMGSRNEALVARNEAIRAKNAAVTAQSQESIAREKATKLADTNQQLARNETLAKEEALASAARESLARAEIETKLHQATALRLASHVQIEREKSPELATLLAIEAVESTRSHDLPVVPLAEQALRDVLGSLGGVGVSGNEIAFSPGSPRFVSGSQVWNLTESGPQPHGKPLSYAAIRDTYGENSGRMFRNTVQTSCGSIVGITPQTQRLLTLSQQPDVAVEIWNLKADEPADTVQLLTHQGKLLTASEWFQETERRPLERFDRPPGQREPLGLPGDADVHKKQSNVIPLRPGASSGGPGAADVNEKQTSIVVSSNSLWAFTSDGMLCFDLDAESVSARPLQLDLRSGEKILAVSDNGQALLASGQQGTRVMLLGENQELLTTHELAYSGSTGNSPGMAGWSAEPLQLVTSRFTGTQLAGKGREAWFWQLDEGQFRSRELGEYPQNADWHVQFSPHGQFVALVLSGQRAEIRACEGGAEDIVYQFNRRPRQLVFSPDERWVVAGNDDGTVE